MAHWWKLLGRRALRARAQTIPDALWQSVLRDFPFLAALDADDRDSLRAMALQFLDQKEFHGAHGFAIDDRIALSIAAQACLPVLRIRAPYQGLRWYDDFVGIVVHAGPVRALREVVDEHGVVHRYEEELSGEAMERGPVTLSWQDVRRADAAQQGYNLVIHEFAHKIDMRNGSADGCPPLPAGFMGADSPRQAHAAWRMALQGSYESFCDKLSLFERFGQEAPWLDAYAAESIDEFFAVATEAYFVNRAAFARDFAQLLPMFDAFFRQEPPPA